MTTPITRLGRAIAKRWRVRHEVRRLSQFSDHMLADIGIARSEIDAAVRGLDLRPPRDR